MFGVPSRALLYLRGWYRKEGLGLGGNAWVGGSWVCLERSTQEGRAPTPPPPPSRWAVAVVVATPFWQRARPPPPHPRGGRWQRWWPHLSGRASWALPSASEAFPWPSLTELNSGLARTQKINVQSRFLLSSCFSPPPPPSATAALSWSLFFLPLKFIGAVLAQSPYRNVLKIHVFKYISSGQRNGIFWLVDILNLLSAWLPGACNK